MMLELSSVTVGILAVLALVLVHFYRRACEYYTLWERKKVPGPKPVVFFGNSNLLKRSSSQLYVKLYNDFPEAKYVGFFEFKKPRLLVRDPELIQKILIKDFSAFMDRAGLNAFSNGRLQDGLFTMNGGKWRTVRAKLSPTFTTGKLKMMFSQMVDCGEAWKSYLDERLDVDIELKDAAFTYTTDVIGSTAFGIDVRTDRGPNSKFKLMAQKAFFLDLPKVFKLIAISTFPAFAKIFKFQFASPDVIDFMDDVVTQSFEHRTKTGEKRNDFLQLLLQLREKGSVELQSFDPDDKYLDMTDDGAKPNVELSDNLLKSQAFTFISAGSEPSANTILFAMYEMARNPEIQEKAREEVRKILERHGEITYESTKEMIYLEYIIKETLRIYPVAQQLLRTCTKPPQRLDEGLTLKGGIDIMISVKALHMDPKYFPEPHLFKPERFEREAEFVRGTYLPFGDGPRICIGMRYAMTEMKVCLATLLLSYNLRESPKTPKPIRLNKWSFFSTPDHPIWLTITKL